MIKEVAKNLWVGDIQGGHAFASNHQGVAVIHACKHPCFTRFIGGKTSNLYGTENGKDLYLNMIDTENPEYFSKAFFKMASKFIDKHIQSGPVVIHCNQGVSRAPMIAMWYLFPDKSYEDAVNSMLDIYPAFDPGPGISMFSVAWFCAKV